jgi:uncharacterized membrane protein
MWIKLGESGKHFFWDVKLIFELIFFKGFAVNDFKTIRVLGAQSVASFKQTQSC